MCKHENVIVTHYANRETNNRIGCRIRCLDCNKFVFKSKDQDMQSAYDYIDLCKYKIKSLDDWTCDDLNARFGISEYKEFCSDKKDMI